MMSAPADGAPACRGPLGVAADDMSKAPVGPADEFRLCALQFRQRRVARDRSGVDVQVRKILESGRCRIRSAVGSACHQVP